MRVEANAEFPAKSLVLFYKIGGYLENFRALRLRQCLHQSNLPSEQSTCQLYLSQNIPNQLQYPKFGLQVVPINYKPLNFQNLFLPYLKFSPCMI